MKAFVVGGLTALAFAGAAQAADMPVKAPVRSAPPPVQAFSWTGCYIGGHAGGIMNASELTAFPLAGATAAQSAAGTHSYDLDNGAFTGGVQYGCNQQFGQWVLGLDSDFAWSGIDESLTASHALVPGLVGAFTETATQNVDWYSTTRGRVGYAYDRWLFFVAGGLASAHIETTYTAAFGGGTFAGSATKTRYGWTVGGGVEYAMTNNWFLRGEYLYVDLGRIDYESFAPTLPGTSMKTEVDTSFHVARVALSYRFTRAPSLIQWALGGFQY
jgi:outer membrane immunogenic protein